MGTCAGKTQQPCNLTLLWDLGLYGQEHPSRCQGSEWLLGQGTENWRSRAEAEPLTQHPQAVPPLLLLKRLQMVTIVHGQLRPYSQANQPNLLQERAFCEDRGGIEAGVSGQYLQAVRAVCLDHRLNQPGSLQQGPWSLESQAGTSQVSLDLRHYSWALG